LGFSVECRAANAGGGVMGSYAQAACRRRSRLVFVPDNDPAQFDTVFTPG
jgi:hypothetical protein